MIVEKLLCILLATTSTFNSPIQEDSLCERSDSCFGEIVSNSERNCRCDEDCFIYGDCCFDANSTSELISHFSFPFKCIKAKTKLKHPDFFYMIADCPKEWENTYIAKKCLHPDDSDFIQTLPVSVTNNSKLTFRNVHCAICHNMDMDNLIPWELKVECPALNFKNSSAAISNLLFNATVKRWEIRSELGYDFCTSTVQPRQTSEISVRLCKGNIISTCPKQWTDLQTLRLCKKQTAYRYQLSKGVEIIFKNKYCAKCNGINRDEMACFQRKTSFPVSRDLTPYQMGKLINFVYLMNGFGLKQTALHCSSGFVFNSKTRYCEELHCNRDTIKVNGMCVDL